MILSIGFSPARKAGASTPRGERYGVASVFFFGANGACDGGFHRGTRGAAHGVHEDAYDFWIELIGGATLELGEGVFWRARFLVGALGGDRVVGVRNGDHARSVGNLFALKAQWITGSVVELVMVTNHFADAAHRLQR